MNGAYKMRRSEPPPVCLKRNAFLSILNAGENIDREVVLMREIRKIRAVATVTLGERM